MTAAAAAAPIENRTAEGCAEMPDEELLARFESASLPGDGFRHGDHVRLAWLLHRRHPPIEALSRLDAGLRRLAAAHGAPGHYHETITWAWSALVRERMERLDEAGREADTWEGFAAASADLLDGSHPILRRYYRSETLGSALARSVFVLPDA